MDRENLLEDLCAHSKLKGKIFQAKPLCPDKLKGLGYFGLAAATWVNFPMIALQLGSTVTTLGMTGAAVAGMLKFQDRDYVNSIEMIRSG